jgi:hypothetical protein
MTIVANDVPLRSKVIVAKCRGIVAVHAYVRHLMNDEFLSRKMNNRAVAIETLTKKAATQALRLHFAPQQKRRKPLDAYFEYRHGCVEDRISRMT